MENSTIYALSTPLGNGIAVIRISGPQASKALQALFSHRGEYISHHLYYGKIGKSDHILDEGMAVLMRAPKSYTGEDCVEFHCHGSRAVVQALFDELHALGLSPAEPGEFSHRAFENGKMDLAQAEAVMDLIHADAQRSAHAALTQLQGHLSSQIVHIQDRLTDVIAELEAAIDYPEEDWLDGVFEGVFSHLKDVQTALADSLATSKGGRILREGFKVALIGRPNVGKSTLFNALLGANRAIVTSQAGTTRDLIEESLEINGYWIRLLDTAGIRSSDDEVEKIGIARTREQLASADILLLLLDASQPLQEEDFLLMQETAAHSRLVVLNKSDLPSAWHPNEIPSLATDRTIAIAAKQADGLKPLIDALDSHLNRLLPSEGHSALFQNQRHLDAAKRAYDSVCDALHAMQTQDMDCVSIDARRAWSALGEITGETVDESIIDRIFSTFCLGK